MRRIVVHAGFHKTGTTTVQTALQKNRAILRPYLQIIMRPGMVAACEAARAYSLGADPLELALFRWELARIAEAWDAADRRSVLLASEDLSGHMPGRRGLRSYGAAPQLMQALAETMTQILPGCDLSFFFSTRAARPWLASCYTQNLRTARVTQTAEEYAQSYRSSAELDAIIDQVAAAVAPQAVHRCALEDSRCRRLGPLDPLVDLLDLPPGLRVSLEPQPPRNKGPSQAKIDRLLQLNRSDLDDAALRQAKKRLNRELG